MLKYSLLIVLVIVSACQKKSTSYPEIVPGVSKELAEFRMGQIDSVLYDLHFDIPSGLEDSIPSKLNLSVYLNTDQLPLILDFQPNHDFPIQASINGKDATFEFASEHLVFPKEFLNKGKNEIQISFIAGERSLNRNKEYLFTLLVPDRARTLFPCFDQPNLKARYKLQVTTPANWMVMGPSRLEQEMIEGEGKFSRFEVSDPMSTYLFSFVAGAFDVVENVGKDFKMMAFHMETDTLKTKLSLPQLFFLHGQAKDFLEIYTERKFPFQKMDFAAIFSHPYGGMEHVGAIQYLQQSLFLDSTATERQLLSRAKLIAHETSHMWFGDLVTMKWFDDVWMKEVFANFMADKIVNPIFTEVDHDLQFLTGHYPDAYSVDRTRGANPIRQNLENLNNAGSLYGAIIYNKAPIMMRQLEALLGSEVFRQGLSTYINAYSFGNADWNDLITILDELSELDLKKWSEVWVNSPGRPVFTSKIETVGDKIQKLEIRQQAEQGKARLWPQVFQISLHYPDSVKNITVTSAQTIMAVKEVEGLPEPKSITFNSDGMGYGIFPLNTNLEGIPLLENNVARGQSYINLYENVLIGEIEIDSTIEILLKGLQIETNELILGLITSYVENLYWTYIFPSHHEELLPSLETILYDRMQKDESANIKKTLFNLYKSIAHEGIGLDRLYSLWNDELFVPNLKLNKDDYTSLAMVLALYDHPNKDEILAKTETAIDNVNKLERFQFLKPALSSDAKVRSEFFKSFAEEKNREKERWVGTACYYIHHPLRQEDSIKEAMLSLELLEEIQATGDIFFPKSWLDATIGQYSSQRAWELTDKFLKENPQMDTKLQAKILQATDHLYRCTQLLKKE